MMFIVVLLPAPFGPRKPYIFPLSTLNERSDTATPEPYFFVRCFTSIIVISFQNKVINDASGMFMPLAIILIRYCDGYVKM